MAAIVFVTIISAAVAFSSRADMLPEVELNLFREKAGMVQENTVSLSLIR